MKNKYTKSIMILIIIIIVILLLKFLGVFNYLNLENVNEINKWINSFGFFGPLVYILIYIAVCLFFLPGVPITIIGALAFGPIWGTVWVSIGSTLGAALSFLVGRFVARDMVSKWVNSNPQLKKIDEGVDKQGWRMLMITRLVPIFPFNLQNYVYGLTKINFFTYVLVSWICMIPGTIAYTFAAGAIINGGNIKNTFIYLGIAAVAFVGLSFLPKVFKNNRI
ncbi:TVP38/TMEM64 family protein [Clostridium grantii]|uniref:TVP38/TMEM64 family membrane protein n=1 Tax=Clostridium grantii DSM 8605 TaxID=1121316 RepID=A0A1M5X807_9CLOT|nr:TVP38/TMEM64 family protein [Clostridium grantii]SHH95980.1 Uncharacterized membrane protein YdjX, TVP38/TMEM64 family, SNARE-associated domain [Clostridium grantii DSM 8605]